MLGLYPGAKTRASIDTYTNVIIHGRNALLEAIEWVPASAVHLRRHSLLPQMPFEPRDLLAHLRISRVLWSQVQGARAAVRGAQRSRLLGAVRQCGSTQGASHSALSLCAEAHASKVYGTAPSRVRRRAVQLPVAEPAKSLAELWDVAELNRKVRPLLVFNLAWTLTLYTGVREHHRKAGRL